MWSAGAKLPLYAAKLASRHTNPWRRCHLLPRLISIAAEDDARSTPRQVGAANSGSELPHSTWNLLRISGEGYTPATIMRTWPHGPSHSVTQSGTYIVTAATYGKEPIFGSRARLNLLGEALLRYSEEHGWNLQAWAVFPNHYHFVAHSTSPESLPRMIQRLHSLTARAVNERDRQPGRRIWFQYWDTRVTNQRSYVARLRYVHENAVHHGIVRRASNYPWCSAGWFERKADPAFRRTVLSFPCDRISVPDSFDVTLKL